MSNLLNTSVRSDTRANTHTVTLIEEFDHGSSLEVHQSLEHLAGAARDANWVVDASQLSFVDSSALRLLVALDDHVGGHGSLTVVPTPMLSKLLAVTGMAGRWTSGTAT